MCDKRLLYSKSRLGRTFRSLCFYKALEEEVEGLAAHLAGEHEQDLDLAGGPDQSYVDYAEGLGHEGKPGAEVGYGVVGVLEGGCEHELD